ncbi:MAG: AbrB/MazE/SpoVT family DNA-binding domain-containing protein [Armatimonadota bacterium]
MKIELPALEDIFYGSATLGERGQIVVPAEARKECDIHSGDKLLVFRHPMHPGMLILAKVGQMQQFLTQMSRTLDVMKNSIEEAASADEALADENE